MLVGREMTIGKSNQGQERTDMFDYNRWPRPSPKNFSLKLAFFVCQVMVTYVFVCILCVCFFVKIFHLFLFLNDT